MCIRDRYYYYHHCTKTLCQDVFACFFERKDHSQNRLLKFWKIDTVRLIHSIFVLKILFWIILEIPFVLKVLFLILILEQGGSLELSIILLKFHQEASIISYNLLVVLNLTFSSMTFPSMMIIKNVPKRML